MSMTEQERTERLEEIRRHKELEHRQWELTQVPKERYVEQVAFEHQQAQTLSQTRQAQQFSYYQFPDLLATMPVETEIEQSAPPVHHMSMDLRGDRKKEKKLHRGLRSHLESRDLEERAGAQEIRLTQQRQALAEQMDRGETPALSEEHLAAEQELLKTRLEAIRLSESAAVELTELEGRYTEGEKLRIRWQAQQDRAEAVGRYARLLPWDSALRRKAMKKKEEYEIKANKFRKEYKISQIQDPALKKREAYTFWKHGMYDLAHEQFHKSTNPLSREDATWVHPENGHLLINVGRAFMGGTKPMYIFEDRRHPILDAQGKVRGYKQYLFKEAVNCLGAYKPEGALLTAEASRLQDYLCGPYSIPAFFARGDGGQVLGSFQERVLTGTKEEGAIDLYAWQGATVKTDLPQEKKDELLREHMLDWLLCNFDTKGENFLNRTDGHLCSYDKEASFSFLNKKDSHHMSTTYKPHTNETIYNTIFTEFAEGRMTLDLQKTCDGLARMAPLNRETYLQMFQSTLEKKYGAAGPNNKERQKAEDLMWARAADLREEYRRFYGELIQRRKNALKDDPNAETYDEMLDETGRFIFADEEGGPERIAANRAQRLHGVVKTIKGSQIPTTGTASFRKTVTPQQGEQYADASGGFLYTTEEEGQTVLRQTMPETIDYGGQQVKLRENYNRLVKVLLRMSTDENGLPREGTEPGLSNFELFIERLGMQMAGSNPKEQVVIIDNACQEFLSEIFADTTLFADEAAVKEFQDFLKATVRDDGRSGVLGMETITAMTSYLDSAAMIRTPLEESMDTLTALLKKEGRKADEIGIYQEALRSMYRDVEVARQEVVTLRDLDLTVRDVPLVNACTANADTLGGLCAKERNRRISPLEPQNRVQSRVEYRAADHIIESPTQYLEWIEAHLKKDSNFISKKSLPGFLELAAEIRKTGTCTYSQASLLGNFCGAGLKYGHHAAALVGELPDGTKLTVETFAPETTQFTVSPFTRHAAVGVYHGDKGMQTYYNTDEPLADDKAMIYGRVKQLLIAGQLTGRK